MGLTFVTLILPLTDQRLTFSKQTFSENKYKFTDTIFLSTALYLTLTPSPKQFLITLTQSLIKIIDKINK